jgi:hypothetical protein
VADAGWFRDPQDPSAEMYYDGQAWTGHRRPAPPVQWPAPATPATPQWPAPATPAAPQWTAPSPHAPGYAPGAQPAAQAGGWPQPGAQGAWAPGPAAGAWAPPGTAPWPAPGTAPKRSTRRPLILALVAVVVVAAGLITWLAWPDAAPKLTYQGQAIAAPADVLTTAETSLAALVKSRHGVQDSATRCYYTQPKTPASGAKKSDIEDKLRCGPVLFVDGEATKTYLVVPLAAGSSSGGKVTLTPQRSLTGLEPVAIDNTLRLVRPDDKSAPDGSDGLKVPTPPAAAKDLLTTASLGPTSAPPSLDHARIVGKNAGVTLEAAGPIDRYAAGDDARSAPPGQQLIAFQLSYGEGDVSASGSARASVEVIGGATRPVPETTGSDEWVIVAIPTSGSAQLRFTDDNYTQTLSLPDGKPGATNLAVLSREHRTAVIGKTASVPMRYSEGSNSANVTFHASAGLASLDYWIPGHEDKHAKDATHAILSVEVDYTDPDAPGKTFGFDPELLRLKLPNGTTIQSRNVASGNKIFDVFDVPASFTKGTLEIRGSEKVDKVTVQVQKTVSFVVSIPAG